MKDISLLKDIIIGRVEPHIYAFETNTIPNYLKVGDTYRPVSVRLKEWRRYYPDLEKKYDDVAKVTQDVYYRDFSVHYYLENEKLRNRLRQEDFTDNLYYSQEFFENATADDIKEAVKDIRKDYEDNGGKYRFYTTENRLPETYVYNRTECYDLRPNQQATVDAFINAVDTNHTNLLMYAVMRFGKSFTSMCCALKIDANVVVIVSAKADVKEEWKKTIQSHIFFKDFVFLDSNSLSADENIISKTINEHKKVAIFLTLEDLQGKEVKEKHKEIFAYSANDCLDLLIIDETHFGARAEKYGSVLREYGKKEIKDKKSKKEDEDFLETSEADEQIKILKAKIRLHLSGTPYRILMGEEFSEEDIITFYPFSNLVKDKEDWDIQNLDKLNEWDNPYYGFPQMIRFAFNLNQSSITLLKDLKKSGETCAFSALFRTKSLRKDKTDEAEIYKIFEHEKEIIDLLEVIDGTKEDNGLLGFLDYEGIKKGHMCHHIVMVLPYRASCDAMEELIKNNSNRFKNLKDYTVVNISGLNPSIEFKEAKDVKKYIADCEEKKKKTLTLTVNRMMTGSTVPEWDTMLYLKDTSSPQEYDQAIFRLQNQYIKNVPDGDGNIIKYNMKPQTLLVDFMPDRLFRIQEQRAQIYNANVNDAGNSNLEERIRDELKISPVITLNKNKIVEVEAADIISALSEYSKSRGVAEETGEIPVDLSLMENDVIRKAIERENEIGSKDGFTIKGVKGDGSDINIPPVERDGEGNHINNPGVKNDDRATGKDPVKQFRSYYARILFFSFLTRDSVESLSEIIEAIGKEDNSRIAKNVGISKLVLSSIKEHINIFVLRDLDYKIYNLNKLSKDASVEPLEKARIAVQKFGKLGKSEVITPELFCEKMIAQIPDEALKEIVQSNHKILNIAGKTGEFELAIYERYLKLGYREEDIKDIIYSIPTSGLTYEFTRMVYEILGLNTKNIAERVNSYSLLDTKKRQHYDYDRIGNLLSQSKSFNTITLNDIVNEEQRRVQFDIVVGNPPYQLSDGGAQESARPIYHLFIEQAKNLNPKYITMIIPSRWMTGGKGLDSFRKEILKDESIRIIHDFPSSADVFPSVQIKAGVCYFLWDRDNPGLCSVSTHMNGNVYGPQDRHLMERNIPFFIRFNKAIPIFHKVWEHFDFKHNFSDIVSSRKPFGLGTGIKGHKERELNDVILYGNKLVSYINRDDISVNKQMIDKYKVYISYAYGAGEDFPHQIINKPFLGEKESVCSETYLVIGPFNSRSTAENVISYMSTKFFRFLVLLLKSTQHATREVYSFVPMQDFSKHWTDEALFIKYELEKKDIAFINLMVKPMGED